MAAWKFDKNIAEQFEDHARQHIPNYDLVIAKSVDICKQYHKQSCIVDVGSATGRTLIELNRAGFTNLIGIDNSADMLAKTPAGIAQLICSPNLPNNAYDVIIMNWTLHFILDKKSYLESVYKNLNKNGTFILSDKTANESYPLEFYHKFKSRQGVSDEDIKTKAQSLIGVMHINDIEWYIQTLKQIGFQDVYIFDASWCFTSFVCRK